MYDDNVYYSPESQSLTSVAEIEWRDEAYEFDLTGVWIDKEGNWYTASDSGCSCPVPFEDHKFPDDYKKFDTPQALLNYIYDENVRNNLTSEYEYQREYGVAAANKFSELASTVIRYKK